MFVFWRGAAAGATVSACAAAVESGTTGDAARQSAHHMLHTTATSRVELDEAPLCSARGVEPPCCRIPAAVESGPALASGGMASATMWLLMLSKLVVVVVAAPIAVSARGGEGAPAGDALPRGRRVTTRVLRSLNARANVELHAQ